MKYDEAVTEHLIAIAREYAGPAPHDQPVAELLVAMADRLETRHAVACIFELKLGKLIQHREERKGATCEELAALKWTCKLCGDTEVTIEPEKYPEGWGWVRNKDVCKGCIEFLGKKVET